MFRTSDLYVAAGLQIAGGRQADRLEIDGGIVYCHFDAAVFDSALRALHSGDLKVDVRALRIEHIALKKKVFELVDKKGKSDETSSAA